MINREEIKTQLKAMLNRFITTALVMDYTLPQDIRDNMGYIILDIFKEIIEEMDKRQKQDNITDSLHGAYPTIWSSKFINDLVEKINNK